MRPYKRPLLDRILDSNLLLVAFFVLIITIGFWCIAMSEKQVRISQDRLAELYEDRDRLHLALQEATSRAAGCSKFWEEVQGGE